MKSPKQPHLQLVIDILMSYGEKCSTDVSRDVKTIVSRCAHEGDSFLTITLPKFCDDFFSYLENGNSSDLFIGWKKRLCLPVFLQGFTRCADTNKQGDCYAAIRQICYFLKKQKISCNSDRIAQSYQSYKEIDETLDLFNEVNSFDRLVGRIIINELFPKEIDYNDLTYHHGPGAVFERLTPNKKFFLKKLLIPSRYKDTPLDCHLLYNSEESYNSDTVMPNYVDDFDCPVRVITVPKTQKSPRVIAVEPAYNQFIQQGIKDYMVDKIEKHPLTRGHINFSNQEINKNLAYHNSFTKLLGTIDFKEASDRVHNRHVHAFFSVNRSLDYLLQKSRSPYALVNDELLLLKKFASMGSAVCFPVEALVFFIYAVSYRLTKAALSPTLRNITKVSKQIYVYGDDVLIPATEVEDFIPFVHERGLMVSLNKTFYKSSFRESCGCDAYAGEDITPVYLRQVPRIKSIRDSEKILSLISTGNQLLEKGLYLPYTTIKTMIERVTGKLPFVHETSPGIGWRDPFIQNKYKWNHLLHRFEVKTYVIGVRKFTDNIGGYPALSRSFISPLRERKITQSKRKDKTSTQSVRRGSVTLRNRWTTNY